MRFGWDLPVSKHSLWSNDHGQASQQLWRRQLSSVFGTTATSWPGEELVAVITCEAVKGRLSYLVQSCILLCPGDEHHTYRGQANPQLQQS